MNIVSIAARGAVYADGRALTEHRPTAAAYEQDVAAYAAGGDAADLWDALRQLSFANDEIQAHVNRPGWRMPQGYLVSA